MTTTPRTARLRALRRAKDAMDRRRSDPRLDLAAIAAHAGYSPRYFLRAFKRTYGETPLRYLGRRRMEHAEELLRAADLSVTEVCERAGFASLGSFSTRFKARTGVAPGAYRARHRGGIRGRVPTCYMRLLSGAGGGGRARCRAPGGGADGRGVEGSGEEGNLEEAR
ncbi:helix-turn-helix transcriptional regulator [Streptomyces sulphureus]|uniref:helix-turn-helix transcriptional regulator n=1 Tax=Streptomyces sulphureus TaxID=47758 RepID=UPI000380B1C9|nr:helix-turn-helix transcriptional regulator [Streptomyces sulphureus]